MIDFQLHKHQLKFNFSARTSRGSIKTLDILLLEARSNGLTGWGEICVLPGLSIDDKIDYSTESIVYLEKFRNGLPGTTEEILDSISQIVPETMPSLKMGLETALLDLHYGGEKVIFPGDFQQGDRAIPINGLIWMGHSEDMLRQVREKVSTGFDCIKIKIGGIDFELECDILDYVRRRYYTEPITLRLDANGSFDEKNALGKLHRLAEFDIHSIEQPLKPGNPDTAKVISESPIPIALDEELIGVGMGDQRMNLLDSLNPSYLVLKPSLLGGFRSVANWIELAEERNIGWWITSSLESNIGLNAIAQFTSNYKNSLHQGLGTGKLYSNNFPSPLEIKGNTLWYNKTAEWSINPSYE